MSDEDEKREETGVICEASVPKKRRQRRRRSTAPVSRAEGDTDSDEEISFLCGSVGSQKLNKLIHAFGPVRAPAKDNPDSGDITTLPPGEVEVMRNVYGAPITNPEEYGLVTFLMSHIAVKFNIPDKELMLETARQLDFNVQQLLEIVGRSQEKKQLVQVRSRPKIVKHRALRLLQRNRRCQQQQAPEQEPE